MKFFGFKLSNKKLSLILCVITALSLIPLILMAINMVPFYDDYGYVKYSISFQKEYGPGLVSAVRGALFQAKEQWWAWQGAFSTIFITALSPLGFSDSMYFVGGLFLILISVGSSIWMMYLIPRKVFGLSPASSLCIGLLSSFLIVQKMYYPMHGFFWYNGGIHYVGMHSFMMIVISCIICFSEKKGAGYIIAQILITTVFAAVVGGGNYTTILQGGLTMLVLAGYVYAKYRSRVLRLIAPVVAFAFCAWKNIVAPGNSVRGGYFEDDGLSAPIAVLRSFTEGTCKGAEFMDVFTVILLLMLIPVVWNGLKGSGFKFRFPLIFIVMAYGIYCAGFTPNLYVNGSVGIPRVLNACKESFHIAVILTVIYVIGWVRKRTESRAARSMAKENGNKQKTINKQDTGNRRKTGRGQRPDFLTHGYVWFYAACGLLVIGLMVIGHLPFVKSSGLDSKLKLSKQYYTSFEAVGEIASGEVKTFRDEYNKRIEKIRAAEGGFVLVDGYTVMPRLLIADDLSDDPAAEPNRFMAEYYGIEGIAIRK